MMFLLLHFDIAMAAAVAISDVAMAAAVAIA
jgi:hypothetical protein